MSFSSLDFSRSSTCVDVRNRNVNDDELTQVAAALPALLPHTAARPRDLTCACEQVMIPRLQLPCYFYRLRTLMLDYNKIGDKGAVALS